MWYTLEDLAEAISIHAPTRGATGWKSAKGNPVKFQSTLPRGERPAALPSMLQDPDFNPRSHEGSDEKKDSQARREVISIHAPTRGATRWMKSKGIQKGFQSTLPRGERRAGPRLLGNVRVNFNPRSHEGSDTDAISVACKQLDFNPRSHEGSDEDADIFDDKGKLFQSTLPRGERLSPGYLGSFPSYFNPRSHEGSDTCLYSTS